ncbi:MAG TPA: hypothetical protein VMQ11_11570 [Alphaproteobacteria bacterium]|nr:hypothetical protein [Alphaproteobacteria bacterium]
MNSLPTRPDPGQWARKLHEAAAELRNRANRPPNGLKLASRLERYAEAILSPRLDRDRVADGTGGDD